MYETSDVIAARELLVERIEHIYGELNTPNRILLNNLLSPIPECVECKTMLEEHMNSAALYFIKFYLFRGPIDSKTLRPLRT